MVSHAMLGPQRRSPNLASVLDRLGVVNGNVCTITAGWQEREGELEELRKHLGREIRDLGLYRRAEAFFDDHPEFHSAYRNRQRLLKDLQRLYRRRLAHAYAAYVEMMREPSESAIVRNEQRAALRALRTLDHQHLRRIRRIHSGFAASTNSASHAGLQRCRDQIRTELAGCAALLLAGGHVEVLLNRLRLFDIADMMIGVPVIAWSAGAMALSDRVVLFHDHPPQGAGVAEVSDIGLGLFPGVVPLPHAGQRLRLHDTARVSLFSRRFAPARCVTLDSGAILVWRDDELCEVASSFRLTHRGALRPVTAR